MFKIKIQNWHYFMRNLHLCIKNDLQVCCLISNALFTAETVPAHVQVQVQKLPAQNQSHLHMCRRAGGKSNTEREASQNPSSEVVQGSFEVIL